MAAQTVKAHSIHLLPMTTIAPTYKRKLIQIKSEIDALTKQHQNLEQLHPRSFDKRKLFNIYYFKSRFPLKNNWLGQMYFHLLALRYSELLTHKVDKKEVGETRNAITAILGLWEDDLGKNFLEFYENKYPVHLVMNNAEIAKHFRMIGYALDKMEAHAEKQESSDRKKSVSLRLRYKFLIMFCNAINFKKLISEIENLGEYYSSSKEILDTLYNEFDVCIDEMWRHYFTNRTTDKPNIFEMQRSLGLIDFIKKLASFLLDKKRMNQYKKKYEVWNKYINKLSE